VLVPLVRPLSVLNLLLDGRVHPIFTLNTASARPCQQRRPSNTYRVMNIQLLSWQFLLVNGCDASFIFSITEYGYKRVSGLFTP